MYYLKLFDKKICFTGTQFHRLHELFPWIEEGAAEGEAVVYWPDEDLPEKNERVYIQVERNGRDKYLLRNSGSGVTIGDITGMQLRFNPKQLRVNYIKPAIRVLLQQYLEEHLNGLVLHAAGVVYDNRLIVLTGANDAGKTTIAASLAARGSGSVLHDDSLLVRVQGNHITVASHPLFAPWEEHQGVDSLVFLEPESESVRRLASLPPAAGAAELLKNIAYCYCDNARAAKFLSIAALVMAGTGKIFSYSYCQDGDVSHIHRLYHELHGA